MASPIPTTRTRSGFRSSLCPTDTPRRPSGFGTIRRRFGYRPPSCRAATGTGSISRWRQIPAAQQQLAKQGLHLPLHNSGHPSWTGNVDARLRQIETELEKPEAGLAKRSHSGSADEYDLAVWMAVKMLQAKLRQEAMGVRRIVENDDKSQAAHS